MCVGGGGGGLEKGVCVSGGGGGGCYGLSFLPFISALADYIFNL